MVSLTVQQSLALFVCLSVSIASWQQHRLISSERVREDLLDNMTRDIPSDCEYGGRHR